VALVVASVGCTGGGRSEVEVVRVDGTVYSYADFERFVRRNASEAPSSLSDEVLSALFQKYVDELCMQRMAAEGALDVGELSALASPLGRAIREEARRRFERNREEYELEERIVLGQVLAQEEATARKVHARVLEGVDLEEAASDLDGAVFSGYQEGVIRQDLPLSFSGTIFSLQAGEVSPVLPADYGFHIFHVLERFPAQALTFEEARPGIELAIAASRSAVRLRSMVAEARVRYNVVLQLRNLPFELAPAD
jgi:hypothetical protein